MKRSLIAISIVGLFVYGGCSSEETVSKAPSSTTDSGVAVDSGSSTADSGTKPLDSGAVVTDSAVAADTNTSPCVTYCNCMATACAAKAPADCVNACQAQTTWDLGCRSTHCGYAATTPVPHCDHAAGGNATCQ